MKEVKKYPSDKYVLIYTVPTYNPIFSGEQYARTFSSVSSLEEFVNNLMSRRENVSINYCFEVKQEYNLVAIDVVTKWQLQVKS